MVSLQVKRPVRLTVDKSILLQAAQQTLELTGVGLQLDLGIVFADDILVRKLNRQYRGVDDTTDVLSFQAGEVDPDTSDLYLGDVIISLPRAEYQANAGRHPLAAELQLLVVHGVLHLLGYDHAIAAEKKKMQAIQDKILAALGLGINIRL